MHVDETPLPPPTTMIEVRNLSIRFRSPLDKTWYVGDKLAQAARRVFRRHELQYHYALRNVNFVASEGDIIGVVGPNGGGKSTLLRAISGIYHPDDGSVACRGRMSSLLALGTAFDDTLNGINNIFLCGLLSGMPAKRIREKMPDIVAFSGIGEHIYKPMKYYSSGMVSRLGFAIAVAMAPEILLADEIFSVGDLEFRKKSGHVIHDLLQKTACQLIVTHNLEFVTEHCNRAIYIRDGKIVMDDSPSSVLAEYERDAES